MELMGVIMLQNRLNFMTARVIFTEHYQQIVILLV
jgi:hypothetical protein